MALVITQHPLNRWNFLSSGNGTPSRPEHLLKITIAISNSFTLHYIAAVIERVNYVLNLWLYGARK